MQKTKSKSAITRSNSMTRNNKPGRNALPMNERKQTIGVGLKPNEIELLEAQCAIERKRRPMAKIDNSSLLRYSWLMFTALTELVSNGEIDVMVIDHLHAWIAKREGAIG